MSKRESVISGIVLVLVSIVCVAFAAAQPMARPQVQQPTRYWQDVIKKPTQNWSSNVLSDMPEATQAILALDRLFGRLSDNDSQLASALWEQSNSLKVMSAQMSARIAVLTQRVDALEKAVVEPNEVVAEDPNATE